MADTVEVLEPIAIQAVFCDGLHMIELDRHGIAHLTLYAEQRESYTGVRGRVLVARLILPGAVIADIGARLLGASRESVLPVPADRPRVTN